MFPSITLVCEGIRQVKVRERNAPSSPPLLRPKMPELDALRGIACLMVLFFHGFGNRFPPDHFSGVVKAFVWTTTWGWTGVNLFFVLSGLLITGILLDTRDRPGYYKRFYIRRMLRILPAYYAVLGLLTVLWLSSLIARPASWGFLGLSFVYVPNLTPLFGVPVYYPVLWSLGVEEHFYLLWPACVRRLSLKTVFFFALTICLCAALARIVTFHFGHDAFGHYTWLVADGLAMGAALAAGIRWSQQRRSVLWWMVGCSFGVALLCFLVDRLLRNPPLAGGSLHITAINASYAGLLAAALLLGSRFGIRSRILEFFGDISYGLYLVHILIFDLFDSAASRFFPALAGQALPFASICLRFAVVAAVTVVVAWISRWYFEEPFLRLKARFTSASDMPENSEPLLSEVARAS